VTLSLVACLTLLVATLGNASPGSTVPPPTPVPPDGHLSPFPTALATPADTGSPPSLSARGALLADLDTGEVLFREGADVPRPIASLTKVMTALLVLERVDPRETVVVEADAVFDQGDYGATSTLGLRAGERLRAEELLYGMLLGSANDAAVALSIHVSGSEGSFITEMNARAAALGMRHTRFTSVTGLDDRGRSTPRDLLLLVRAAEAIPLFSTITGTRVHTITGSGPDRRIQNRNILLWLYEGALGVKTGTTAGAGPCVIATAERDGRRLVAIVLHADGEAFSDAASLLNFGFEGTARLQLVTEGETLGELAIRGGSVPVVAGADLTRYVPASAVIERQIAADPRVTFPPVPGEQVGTLTIRASGMTVGSVPVVVASVPLPPIPSDRPWWLRTLTAVWDAARDAIAGLTG
jgi:D-alanyl-D-alanine carboxypeptidase (penicillin-binding protein 5/6)